MCVLVYPSFLPIRISAGVWYNSSSLFLFFFSSQCLQATMLQLELSLVSLTAAMDAHVHHKEQQKDEEEETGNGRRRRGDSVGGGARTGDGTTSSSTSTSSWSSKSFSVSVPAAAPISPLRWKYSNHRRQHHQRARSWGTVSNKSCDDGAASSVSSFSSSSFTSRALLQQLTIHRKKKKKKGFVVLVDPHDPEAEGGEAEAEATERVLPSTTPPQSPSRRNYLQLYPRRPRSRSEAAASSNSYVEEFSVISSLASKTTQSEVVPAKVLQQVSLNRKKQHGRRRRLEYPPGRGSDHGNEAAATAGLLLLPPSPTRNAPSHPHRRHHSYDAATVPTATAAAAAARQHRRCKSKEAFPPIQRPVSLTVPVAHQRIVRVEVIERHPGRTSSRGRQHRGSPAVVELVTNTRPKKQDDDEEEWSGGSSIEVTTRLSTRSSAGVRNSTSSAAKTTSRNSGNGSRSQIQDENENENETHDLFGLDIEIDEDAEDEDEEEYFYCLDDPVDSLERTTPLIYDADTGVLPASATNAARRSTSNSKSKSTTTSSSASGQEGPGRSDFFVPPCPYPAPPQQERPHHPDNLMMFVSNERNILEYTANELRI